MGGGAVRTAAKAAVLGGYRFVGPLADHPSAAARRVSRPCTASVSAVASVTGPVVSGPSSETSAPVLPVAVEKPSWKIDDWEFAGDEEVELFDAIHPSPRLVFGRPPTLEEAKEATSDLKDTLEKAYFSPGISDVQGSKLLGTVCLESSETKVCVTSGNGAILPSMPKHVVQAFSLLQGSPEAQDVVASLASDKNVWDAVMKNEKVMQFYRTHQSSLASESVSNPGTSVAENLDDKVSMESLDANSSGEPCEKLESGFVRFMKNVKTKLTEMVNSLSDFLEDIMGTPTGGHGSTSTRTSTAETYANVGIGSSFIALAVAVILVILLKRG